MVSLIATFLSSLAEVFEALRHEAGLVGLKPSIAVALTLALTCVAAFSQGLLIPALILALAFTLALSLRAPLRYWSKPVLFVALWSTVVSIPLAFIGSPPYLASLSLGGLKAGLSLPGLVEAAVFVLRASSAAAVFTLFIQLTGWRRWLEGLASLKVPKALVKLALTSIIYIPLFLREASKMLSARESRLLSRGGWWGRSWRLLSTVVGDLLLKGYDRAWRLEKALKARSFIQPFVF